MATLVVGDVQGCYEELRELLEVAQFDSATDQLWLVGDLVNRGPASLDVLRYVSSLGPQAIATLGNHDLHLLAIAYGGHRAHQQDTLAEVLAAPDLDELLAWLRQQPLLHYSAKLNVCMVHAGLPHFWSVERAAAYAHEVQRTIRGPEYRSFFRDMYGNQPDNWHDDLMGMDRLRVITNYLTRMRLISADGRLEFRHKGPWQHPIAEGAKSVEGTRGIEGAGEPAKQQFRPWFSYQPQQVKTRILFGHWAAIDGVTQQDHAVALDTGCVWGRTLTGLRLDDNRFFRVCSRQPDAGHAQD